MWNIVKDKVFDLEWCSKVITMGALYGFNLAPIKSDNVESNNPAVRNNYRAVFEDSDLAREVESGLKNVLIPHEMRGMRYNGISSYFRIYKYLPGQYFKTHRDGCFTSSQGETQLTVLIYLNDCPTGSTILYPYGEQQKWAAVEIKPSTGKVLIFDHNIPHASETVLNGSKYVLRTDVFYK